MRIFLVLIATVFMASCATKYGDMGFSGGVSEQQIGERVWQIRGAGNAFTSLAATDEFIQLRAAEIGKRYGYSHFSTEASASHLRTETFTTNTSSFNSSTNCFGGSCYSSGTYSGPTTSTFHKPLSEGRYFFVTQDEYQLLPENVRMRMLSVDMTFDRLAAKHGLLVD